MEIEVTGLTGGGHDERSPVRLARRNGYRGRDCETRAGTVELRIPKRAVDRLCSLGRRAREVLRGLRGTG
jgi:transposase-like protein